MTEMRVSGFDGVIVTLVNLYGIPKSRIDLSRYTTIRDKITAARADIIGLVPKDYRARSRLSEDHYGDEHLSEC